MQRLDVREQIRLPLRRILEICSDSISYRLIRSAVTVAIILLATAFLMAIIADKGLGSAARDAVRVRAERLTAASRFLGTLGRVPGDDELVARLAALQPGSVDWTNARRWSGLAENDFGRFLVTIRQLERYLAFFETIPAGRRVLLTEQAEGLGIFDWLTQPGNRALFAGRLEPMKSLKLPGTRPEFDVFVAAWPGCRDQLNTLKRGYAATVEHLRTYGGQEGLEAALQKTIEAGRIPEFLADMDRAGIAVDPASVPAIAEGLQAESQLAWATELLKKQPVRAGWFRHFNEKFNPPDALRRCASSRDDAQWVVQTGGAAPPEVARDAPELQRIARQFVERDRTIDADRRLQERYGLREGVNERLLWLMIVSFLVCTVGIANAMLMSVLERFKEIATMKCLGARKETIGILFITESVFMGFLGGVLGVLAGLAIACLRQSAAYGHLALKPFPWGAIAAASGICLGCSLLLSIIAALYPARVAARMEPMEAMRVE